MSTSLYWDDFERRIDETVNAIKDGKEPVVRRVAVFITDKCNFTCKYCNHKRVSNTLSEERFKEVLEKYGDTAIIHITGGEPSTVPWLYQFLINNGDKYRFHLNTNAYIEPPYRSVKRLKVSLDDYIGANWDCLVGKRGAFDLVVNNIKQACKHTVTSITYTLTRENYLRALDFVKFANKEFQGLYAVFFSVYKGLDTRFRMNEDEVNTFFNVVLPQLKNELGNESKFLIEETIDEKKRLMQGIRFPENRDDLCYISMSERVISPDGNEYRCSHLYRDNIHQTASFKHEKCLYGCNRRLVKFNQDVGERLAPK